MGVDIGSTRVHVIEFSGGSRMRVSGYGNAALPDEAVSDERIVDTDAVGVALKKALKKSSIGSKSAGVAVSGPAVISKIIEMPASLGDAEIEEQIHHDAESYIPHPIEEVNLDFRVVEADPNNPEINRVMLVACRRETVATYVEALQKAGLKTEFVDLESSALENACGLLIDSGSPDLASRNVAVLDVRFDQTRLTVHRDDRSVYTRELNLGIRHLVQDVLDTQQVLDAAELFEALRDERIGRDEIADEVADFAHNAAAQIEQSLQFFTSAAAYDEVVEQVIVVGEIGLFPGVEEALKQHIDRQLDFGNPVSGFALSGAAKRNHVEWEGPALAVASGLAIRSIR